MIPKIIHYCWLSNDPLPADIQGYMSTWEKHLPDYEIIKWDFNRFPREKSDWVREAFDNKKYAFAADYLRLYAIYNYGGIYLDSDVEVLRSFNDLLTLDTMLCYENLEGEEKIKKLEVAAFGAAKGQQWIADCLMHYDRRHFVKENGELDIKTLPEVVGECLKKNGYTVKDVFSVEEARAVTGKELPVFPFDYFSPKDLITMEVNVTKNTYSIHNYKGSWSPAPMKDILLSLGVNYKAAMTVVRLNLRIKAAWNSIWNGTFFKKLKSHLKK